MFKQRKAATPELPVDRRRHGVVNSWTSLGTMETRGHSRDGGWSPGDVQIGGAIQVDGGHPWSRLLRASYNHPFPLVDFINPAYINYLPPPTCLPNSSSHVSPPWPSSRPAPSTISTVPTTSNEPNPWPPDGRTRRLTTGVNCPRTITCVKRVPNKPLSRSC